MALSLETGAMYGFYEHLQLRCVLMSSRSDGDEARWGIKCQLQLPFARMIIYLLSMRCLGVPQRPNPGS